MRETKNYSLAKISSELGVSKTAVSLVLNGKGKHGGISAGLQRQILEFCDKVNYRPNIHAQRMNCRQVKNIGVLIEDMGGIDEHTPFGEYNVPQILGGIAVASDDAGYRFTLQLYRRDMDETRIFDWFKTREIDGLIYYGFEMPEHWRETFVAEKRHVVGVSIRPCPGIGSVNVDNFEASLKLTEHLISRGRRRFLYLGGLPQSYPAEQRYAGFRAALDKHGIEFDHGSSYLPADFDYLVGEKFIRERWMVGALVEDAIVCASDNLAVSAIMALNSSGVRVPEQIAVAGADNIPVGRFITPALTTFDYLPPQLGQAAFDLLYRMMRGEPTDPVVTLKTHLCLRNSA